MNSTTQNSTTQNCKTTQPVGIVSSTKFAPSTTDTVTFIETSIAGVEPFDIFKIDTTKESNSDQEKEWTYIQVISIAHYTDANSHEDNFTPYYFRRDNITNESTKDCILDRMSYNVVTCKILSNSKNRLVPPKNGRFVYYCDENDVLSALGLPIINNTSDKIPPDIDRIPIGFIRMYKYLNKPLCIPISIKKSFLLGCDGAHLNICGISGLATKTTTSMTIINAIMQNQNNDSAAIIFNVKGDNLLNIDIRNTKDKGSKKDIDYSAFGVDISEPFKKVKYFFPYGSTNNNKKNSSFYSYPFNKVKEQINKYYLHLFDADPDDTGTLYSFLNIIFQNENFEKTEDWERFMSYISQKKNNDKDSGISPMTYSKALRMINSLTNRNKGLFCDYPQNNIKPIDLPAKILRIKNGNTFVIDIHELDIPGQAFVIGTVLDKVLEARRNNKEKFPKKVVVFADEINKYAPSDQLHNPIRDILIDVTERGRSDGVILFSAEQERSKVNTRIAGNCSTTLFGRSSEIELANSSYKSMPQTFLKQISLLAQGHFLLSSPEFITYLAIEEPYPSYKCD